MLFRNPEGGPTKSGVDRLTVTLSSAATLIANGGAQLFVELSKPAAVIAEKFPSGFNPELQFAEGMLMAAPGVFLALWLLSRVDLDRKDSQLFSLIMIPAIGELSYIISALVIGPIFHGLFGPADLMEFLRP